MCIIEILNVILVDIDTGEYSSEEDHYTQLLPQRTHKLTDTDDEISSGFHADGLTVNGTGRDVKIILWQDIRTFTGSQEKFVIVVNHIFYTSSGRDIVDVLQNLM